MRNRIGVTDRITTRLRRGRPVASSVRLIGHVNVRLLGPDGRVKYAEQGRNLITDHGDQFAATRLYDDTVDIVTGMRLGTGTTDPAKSGGGAAIGAYISGSTEALDGPASGSDLGGGAGYRATYVCTWDAGDVTNSAISEVALTDETPLTDVAGTAGNTVARFEFASAIDKQAGDSLEVTWNIDALGA